MNYYHQYIQNNYYPRYSLNIKKKTNIVNNKRSRKFPTPLILILINGFILTHMLFQRDIRCLHMECIAYNTYHRYNNTGI